MYKKFAKTSNVQRLLAGRDLVNKRGAAEASIMLVNGKPGLGKSRSCQWLSVQEQGVFIRLKAAATPHWVLTDLVRELGESKPAFSCEKLFGQAVGYLVLRPLTIVVDEIENGLKDIKVVETLRDISDIAEVPLVLSGREYVGSALRRHSHIWSRISSIVDFQDVTREDIATCARELCEVQIGDDVIDAIDKGCEGLIRNVVNALAIAERVGKRHSGKAVTIDMLGGTALFKDFQAKRKIASAVAA